jgi:hypothetical protein
MLGDSNANNALSSDSCTIREFFWLGEVQSVHNIKKQHTHTEKF